MPSTQIKSNNPEDVLRTVLSGQKLGDLAGSGDVPVDELLKRLQARKLLKEALEDDAKAEEDARLYEARLKAIEEDLRVKKARQDACNHQKENGTTALRGQRDHHGNVQLVCQHCHKDGVMQDWPEHLWPPSDYVGGP